MDNFLNSQGLLKQRFVLNAEAHGELLYLQSSPRIAVRETHNADGHFRWLLLDQVLQSVLNLSAPEHALFPHLQTLKSQWQTLPAPSQVLELGLGGGNIRTLLKALFNEVTVHSVERSQSVIDCYQSYFATDNEQAHPAHIYQADGFHFVAEAKVQGRQYDWVILDVYQNADTPTQLTQPDFWQALKALKPAYLFINYLPADPNQLAGFTAFLETVLSPIAITTSSHKHYINQIISCQLNR